MVGMNAICPECEPRIREHLKKDGEEREMTAECPKELSFKDFVLKVRNGNHAIRIYTAD